MFSHGVQRALNNPVFASWIQTWFTEGCDELIISWHLQVGSGCLLSQECPLRLWHVLRFDTRGASVILCLGSKMALCWSTRAPFSYQNMKNGFVFVCPYGVAGICSHMEHLILPKEGPAPCWASLMKPSECHLFTMTSLCWPSDLSIIPFPYVMQWKPEECLPSAPGPFPLRPNTHISKNIKNHIYLQIGEARGLQLWKMSKKRYHWDWSLCFQAFNSHLWSQSWNFLITSFYCKMSLTIYDTGCLLLDLFLLWGIL